MRVQGRHCASAAVRAYTRGIFMAGWCSSWHAVLFVEVAGCRWKAVNGLPSSEPDRTWASDGVKAQSSFTSRWL